MKTIVTALVALILTLATPASVPAAGVFTVSAQIDGRSQLVVTPTQVYWKHFVYARPGRHLGDWPTLLNGYPWYPQWPNTGDNSAGDSIRRAITATFAPEGVTLAQEAGRAAVTIAQQPAIENQFTLVVEFNDAGPDGPDWYAITLAGVSVTVPPSLEIQVACLGLSWPTESNRLYQLQYSSALTSNEWRDLTPPIAGHGTNALYVDCPPGEPRRFYRVIPLP